MQFSIKDWLKERAAETDAKNSRYQSYFTDNFDLKPEFFAGKRILDVGCGPRGSLEWAGYGRGACRTGPALAALH